MIPELILLAALPAILGPITSILIKKLLEQRKKRDIEVKFQSGERLRLKVDADATEEQIRDLVKHNEQVKSKAAATGSRV
jgi:hypothetical protein